MKNLKIMKSLLFSIVVMLVFVSCSNDDDDDNPNATLKITAGLKNASVTLNKNSSIKEKQGIANLTFTSGYVWISEIVFDGTFTSGSSVSITVERFSKIDFATGVATPSLEDITIPIGEYQDVNLGIELRDEDAQPSIIMDGTYTRQDNSTVPVRFEFNSGEVFEAETDQQVTVAANDVVTSKIVFDPSIWFEVVSMSQLDNADVNGDGIIVISETSNASIFDLVADRLDVSTESEFN